MDDFIAVFESGIHYLRLCLGVLVGLLTIAIFFCVSANVFGRYVLNSSYDWAEAMSRFFFIWAVLVGGGLGCLANENIAVTFIKDAVPEIVAKVFDILKVVLIYAICAIIFVAYRDIVSGYVRLTPLLGISMTYMYSAMLAFAVLLAIANTVDLLRVIAYFNRML